MKKHIIQFCIFLCITLFVPTGCTPDNSGSTISPVTLTEQEKNIALLADIGLGVFDVSIKEDIQCMALYGEIWKYGQCTKSNLIAYGDAHRYSQYFISEKILMNDAYEWTGTQGQILFSNDTGGLGVRCFDEDFGIEGSTRGIGARPCYLGYDGMDPIPLEAGKSYILTALNYDLNGDECQFLTCGTFLEDLDTLKEEEYIITLRMQMFATEEEMKAAVAGQEAIVDW